MLVVNLFRNQIDKEVKEIIHMTRNSLLYRVLCPSLRLFCDDAVCLQSLNLQACE